MDSYSRVIRLELGLNVWRKRNVLRLRLNRARELQHIVSVFREFQTAGAEQRNARSAKWVLVVGLWSSVVEERRWRVDSRSLMWWLRYAGVDVFWINHMQKNTTNSPMIMSSWTTLLTQHNHIQCESKKSPLRFSDNFFQTDENFLINFYTLIIRSFLH